MPRGTTYVPAGALDMAEFVTTMVRGGDEDGGPETERAGSPLAAPAPGGRGAGKAAKRRKGETSETELAERRREWNRNNARKSRERKRFMLSALEMRTEALAKENAALRALLAKATAAAGDGGGKEEGEAAQRAPASRGSGGDSTVTGGDGGHARSRGTASDGGGPRAAAAGGTRYTSSSTSSASVAASVAQAAAAAPRPVGLLPLDAYSVPAVNAAQMDVRSGATVKLSQLGTGAAQPQQPPRPSVGNTGSVFSGDGGVGSYGFNVTGEGPADSEGHTRPRDPAAAKAAAETKPTELVQDDYALMEVVATCKQHFLITDPTLHDNPIVFSSQGFFELTGYAPDEILGVNCRFLQGRDTDPRAIRRIRDALAAPEDVHVVLLNYKKDGTPFWNELFLAPLCDAEGNVVHFVGVQSNIPAEHAKSLLIEQEADFAARGYNNSSSGGGGVNEDGAGGEEEAGTAEGCGGGAIAAAVGQKRTAVEAGL